MITIQWDALLAEQFDMYYIAPNGDKVRPYIIHRTSLGCYERTLAWLIEKYAGKFPTWLCAEQVRVLTRQLITVRKKLDLKSGKQGLTNFLICWLLDRKRKKKTPFLSEAVLPEMREAGH